MKSLLAYTNGTDTYIAYDIDDVRAQIMEALMTMAASARPTTRR